MVINLRAGSKIIRATGEFFQDLWYSYEREIITGVLMVLTFGSYGACLLTENLLFAIVAWLAGSALLGWSGLFSMLRADLCKVVCRTVCSCRCNQTKHDCHCQDGGGSR
jgi:hypothetical protein